MDNNFDIQSILESYDEISIEQKLSESMYVFLLYGKKFLFIAPNTCNPASAPVILLCNDSGLDMPHIMLREYSSSGKDWLPEGQYRYVCLYEQGSIVNTIVPYEEKVIDSIDRLIELLSMTETEKLREYQKEFMFYWNTQAIEHPTIHVYLQHECSFSKMDMFWGTNEIRAIEQGLQLSDNDSRVKNQRVWVQHVETECYYIPIMDCREIVPPLRGKAWSAESIKNIVYSRQIEHISSETFGCIRACKPKTQNVILIFGMKTIFSDVAFAVQIRANNVVSHTLLEKILNDIVVVEPICTRRKDYRYLCNQIGNDIGLIEKKALIIGGGSLGSYIALELVKNGLSHLKIYDGDLLEDENVLRWAYGGFGISSPKARVLSLMLELLHPEIVVEHVDKNIDEKSLAAEVSGWDLIISTVGSSDEQLMFNRVLSAAHCSVPVIYVWLEAGGINSHILVVDYRKPGCYECIYTDENGILTNNKATKNDDELVETSLIRNGCGGTRAAYGTATILRTVAALLDVLQKIQRGEIANCLLIDISPTSICISDTKIPLEACNCCGNK